MKIQFSSILVAYLFVAEISVFMSLADVCNNHGLTKIYEFLFLVSF